MRRLLRTICCSAVVTAALTGCSFSARQAVLEDELRQKDRTIRDLRRSVAETERLLRDQDNELAALRRVAPDIEQRLTSTAKEEFADSAIALTGAEGDSNGAVTTAGLKTAPEWSDAETTDADGNHVRSNTRSTAAMAETLEQQVAWGSVIGIRIHRLMTGFLPDSDGNSTVLNVVIQPYDVDNEIVKVAGEITITVSAMNADGTPAVIGRTEVSLHDSRRHWSRALLSSGFHVPVEISAAGVSQWTSSNPLVVHAALQLAADRRYQATETIFDAARL